MGDACNSDCFDHRATPLWCCGPGVSYTTVAVGLLDCLSVLELTNSFEPGNLCAVSPARVNYACRLCLFLGSGASETQPMGSVGSQMLQS